MTKLKSCPMCGSEARLDDCRTIWRVACTSVNCGVLVLGERAPEPDHRIYPEGYWERYEQTAIDRWNKRCDHTTHTLVEELNDPNSSVSKALVRNFNVQRTK